MIDKDTICAVSTPPGEGGIGIIRVSGRDAIKVVSTVFRPCSRKPLSHVTTHTIHYGHVVNPGTDESVDEVLVSVMRAPATYTREDIVEINCHGGMMPLWRTLSLLLASGARQAEPGEFTKRAFLNGRIDLAQAEAVMDIISAKTDLSHRSANARLFGGLSKEISALRNKLISLLAMVEISIDFPEEDIEIEEAAQLAEDVSNIQGGIDTLLATYCYGKILREGYASAIVGKPNVGKSSLLNALLKQDRAIVSEIPGTTRDVIEEYLNIDGIPIRILDTAGIRHSHDAVEQEGVRRSLATITAADIVLAVLDGSQPLTPEDRRVLESVQKKSVIVIINKSDLPRSLQELDVSIPQVTVSCHSGIGLDRLRQAISDSVKQGVCPSREHAWAVNERQKTILGQTKESLANAMESIKANRSPEFIALDLRGALDSLGLIIGATYTDDILERIFSTFCIGK